MTLTKIDLPKERLLNSLRSIIILTMNRTVEAVIDERGTVRLLEEIHLPAARHAIVTILEDEPAHLSETALLSEPALAEDWNRPEEDAAWAHLQPAR